MFTDHSKDSDCTLGPDDCCVVCHVWHAEPCPECGQRAYHLPDCPMSDATERHPEYRDDRLTEAEIKQRAEYWRRRSKKACDRCGRPAPASVVSDPEWYIDTLGPAVEMYCRRCW